MVLALNSGPLEFPCHLNHGYIVYDYKFTNCIFSDDELGKICVFYCISVNIVHNLCAGSGGWAAVPGASSADAGKEGTEDDS